MAVMLITGAGGRLGKELKKLYPDALSPSREEMDVTNRKSVDSFISKTKPGIVIHLAAMTSVTGCEERKKEAWAANVTGTINLLRACFTANSRCYFMLMSTPCVFDGKRGMYTEEDVPCPENFYGFTKAVAEAAVLSSPLKTVVMRGNFVPREPWPHPGAFVDRWGTYLFADDLARGIKEILDAEATGVVHIPGDRTMSMYELAKITTPNVKALSYEDYVKKGGCRLTQNMTLDTVRWKRLKITM